MMITGLDYVERKFVHLFHSRHHRWTFRIRALKRGIQSGNASPELVCPKVQVLPMDSVKNLLDYFQYLQEAGARWLLSVELYDTMTQFAEDVILHEPTDEELLDAWNDVIIQEVMYR